MPHDDHPRPDDGPVGAGLDAFRAEFRGDVLLEGSAEYDAARPIWNARVQREPTLIAHATGVADVVTAVRFAREHDLPVTARSGGHSIAGDSLCDDGLVIDLGAMNGVRVDPDARIARVAGGATWGAVNHETQAFGLAAPGLPHRSVGVAGYTLGGGMGPLSRRLGLAIDALRSVDVVTADGDLVTASASEHSDLFWALRGGGGNFGIATSFEFDLEPVGPTVLGGAVVHRLGDAAEVLGFYRSFVADAPDALQCFALFAEGGPRHGIPENRYGETVLVFGVTFAGGRASGERLLDPLVSFGDPLVATLQTHPYAQSDDYPPARQRKYYKSRYLDALPDAAIDAIVDRVAPIPASNTMAALIPMDGAVARVDAGATAYPHRDAAFLLGVYTQWGDSADDERMLDWARDLHAAVEPFSTGGEYVNNQTEHGPERVRAAYGDNLDRLAAVKAEWDPENVFSVNQNVAPSG